MISTQNASFTLNGTETNEHGNFAGTHIRESNRAGTDQIYIRQVWKCPVPNNHEVRLLLQLFDDYSAKMLGIGFILFQACRPQEVADLKWSWFKIDKETKEPVRFRHIVYKPTNRIVKSGRHRYYKEVMKEITSPWFRDQIIKYAKRMPQFERDKVFGWTTTDVLQKVFSRLRHDVRTGKIKDPKYMCFLDKNTFRVDGPDSASKHRIYLYSLRKFSISFAYWSKKPHGFNQDIIALSKYLGHSRPDTTLQYYVMPKEAIGLTQEMIDRKISMDEFIMVEGMSQPTLKDYDCSFKKPFTPAGQTSLGDFT